MYVFHRYYWFALKLFLYRLCAEYWKFRRFGSGFALVRSFREFFWTAKYATHTFMRLPQTTRRSAVYNCSYGELLLPGSATAPSFVVTSPLLLVGLKVISPLNSANFSTSDKMNKMSIRNPIFRVWVLPFGVVIWLGETPQGRSSVYAFHRYHCFAGKLFL